MTMGVRKINLSGIKLANRNRSGPKLVHVHKSRGDNVQEIWGSIQGFIQTPQGVITPWFLCNTPNMYTAKGGLLRGVNQDCTIKPIIDKRLQ